MKNVVDWLFMLTGELPREARPQLSDDHPFRDGGIGYSQFNELLLSLGYDRVSPGFFKYVFGCEDSIESFADFRSGVERFSKKAMLEYGNFKYAYKQFAQSGYDDLQDAFAALKPIPLEKFRRHEPLVDIKKISRSETSYLGYLTRKEIMKAVESASTQEEKSEAEARLRRLKEVEEMGRFNHDLYLTYDHMDVYVATSMRRPFDFWNVSRFIENLFGSPLLHDLHLRWFDPTQAYCSDRLDKGLVEGLMLKRAACTIYLAQETETLGKDSELATTLAQGKPVIAYVPHQRDFGAFCDYADSVAEEVYPGRNRTDIAMEFLRIYFPQGAWDDEQVRSWLEDPTSASYEDVLRLIFDEANKMYDQRANTIKDSHPLGLQMDLDKGVANGVIVVRSIAMCAKVLRALVTRTLEFDIEETPSAYLLRERMTDSVFRVVTKDDHLTHAFWNFYRELGT